MVNRPTSTPSLAEQVVQNAASNPPQEDKGFLDFLSEVIGGFLDFIKKLLGLSSSEQNTPDEGTPNAPSAKPSLADRIRIGRSVVESGAPQKWAAFMSAHKGKKVELSSPLEGDAMVTSGYGMRWHPTRQRDQHHDGVDMVSSNRKVVAPGDGIVLLSGFVNGYGNTVVIGYADGRYSLKGHLTHERMPALGAEVKRGEQIGVMGATGDATAPHLHFEVLKGKSHFQPIVNGLALSQGVRVAGAASAPDPHYAALVNRAEMPKLGTSDKPDAPIAFAKPYSIMGAVVSR